MTQVPAWMYGLLVVLGWDEIWSMIRNPFLLVLAIILGGAAFVIWKMGMAGPMITTVKVLHCTCTALITQSNLPTPCLTLTCLCACVCVCVCVCVVRRRRFAPFTRVE
jgi:hypothetical protein